MAGPLWEFFYEPRDFKITAPVSIPVGLFGRILTNRVSYGRPADVANVPREGTPVSQDEAYSLKSPFWKGPYDFSLQNTQGPSKP